VPPVRKQAHRQEPRHGGTGLTGHIQAHLDTHVADGFTHRLLNARQKLVRHPVLDETVGRQQQQFVVRTVLRTQRPDPGVELLGGKLLLQGSQALLPKIN
jgi:hypothetical protein